jgi:Rdx family
LQTFSTDLGEVSLQPSTGGTFKVYLYDEEPGATENDEVTIEEYLLWDRMAESGFPGNESSFVSLLNLCSIVSGRSWILFGWGMASSSSLDIQRKQTLNVG